MVIRRTPPRQPTRQSLKHPTGPGPTSDPIADALQRLCTAAEAAGLSVPQPVVRQVELEVRQAWAGCKVHIPAVPAAQRAERASRIQRAYLQGVRLDEIARQEGVHPRTVFKIVKR